MRWRSIQKCLIFISVEARMIQSGKMNIAIYTSAHGYGHASRSYEIARTLIEKRSDIAVYFNSWVPDSFFSGEENPRIIRRKKRFDVGIRQIDSLTMDLPGTLQDLEDLRMNSNQLIKEEVEFFREAGIELVLADLPHLIFEAAEKAGIPAWGLSNFSWDWIYEEYVNAYPGLQSHIDLIRRSYQRAEGVFRLPFSGGMGYFKMVIDVPLLARRSKLGKTESRKRLEIGLDDPVILFSFGGFKLSIPADITPCDDLILLSSDPSPDPGAPFSHITDEALKKLDLRYCDLVAAADAVVSKLGYGIVSECMANQTALIYTSRGQFREYPILRRAVNQYLPSAEIKLEDLKKGRWLDAFTSLLNRDFPPKPDCSGAETVADKLIEKANL